MSEPVNKKVKPTPAGPTVVRNTPQNNIFQTLPRDLLDNFILKNLGTNDIKSFLSVDSSLNNKLNDVNFLKKWILDIDKPYYERHKTALLKNSSIIELRKIILELAQKKALIDKIKLAFNDPDDRDIIINAIHTDLPMYLKAPEALKHNRTSVLERIYGDILRLTHKQDGTGRRSSLSRRRRTKRKTQKKKRSTITTRKNVRLVRKSKRSKKRRTTIK